MTYHPPGVYVMPMFNLENLSVRKGFYAGGIFSFELHIPGDFPSETPPKIYLPQGFYHPHVNPKTGELDASAEFSKWNPGVSRIYHLLHYLRLTLSEPSVDNPTQCKDSNANTEQSTWCNYANPEAAYVFVTNPDDFEKRAKRYVANYSLWSTPGPDTSSNPIDISGWQDDSLINRIREQVSSSSQPFKSCACCSDASCRGYSWIDPCKMTLFSTDRLVDEKTD
ncbi:hypothetical protein AAHC03_020859 [Spirometra sp. Aus1]